MKLLILNFLPQVAHKIETFNLDNSNHGHMPNSTGWWIKHVHTCEFLCEVMNVKWDQVKVLLTTKEWGLKA